MATCLCGEWSKKSGGVLFPRTYDLTLFVLPDGGGGGGEGTSGLVSHRLCRDYSWLGTCLTGLNYDYGFLPVSCMFPTSAKFGVNTVILQAFLKCARAHVQLVCSG